MKYKKLAITLIIFSILIVYILLIREFGTRQIDDLHPNIPCDEKYLEKSDLILVIPLFENVSISENKTWCKEILSLNKTIGMHGVYHTYREFGKTINQTDINKGKEEFEKCFGFEPEIFEAPQWKLNRENRKNLEEQGFKIKGYFNAFTHKVYHCSDKGEFLYKIFGIKITNRLIDRI